MDAREKTEHVTNKAVALIKALHNPPIGAKEFSGGWCPERCDALLFCSRNAYMIETKICRSDFLADFKKNHRQEGCGLIGNFRYYACPTGLISPAELPEKWGLIYVDCNNKRDRAKMPVGYGGWLPKPGQKGVWLYKQEKEMYGSYNVNEHGVRIADSQSFRFDDTGMERHYLFALATRYKQQKFMDNIL